MPSQVSYFGKTTGFIVMGSQPLEKNKIRWKRCWFRKTAKAAAKLVEMKQDPLFDAVCLVDIKRDTIFQYEREEKGSWKTMDPISESRGHWVGSLNAFVKSGFIVTATGSETGDFWTLNLEDAEKKIQEYKKCGKFKTILLYDMDTKVSAEYKRVAKRWVERCFQNA